MMRRIRLALPDITIMNGYDELLCPGLLYGADGGIGTNYNLFPKLFVQIYESVKKNDLPRAMELQDALLVYADLLWKTGVIPLFEHLMEKRGFGPLYFRRPRAVISPDFLKSLEKPVEKAIAAIEALTA